MHPLFIHNAKNSSFLDLDKMIQAWMVLLLIFFNSFRLNWSVCSKSYKLWL